MERPLVGVIMGSLSDMAVLKPAVALFDEWGMGYEVIVASAHRTPDKVTLWIEDAPARGLEVIIAAAGSAAALPGVVAAQTLLPVIGLPIGSSALKGTDALYSIVQMPPGIPVATVGIDNAVNAAALALQIIARIDPQWESVLEAYRAKLREKVDIQNRQLAEELPHAIPNLAPDFDRFDGPPAESSAGPISVAPSPTEASAREFGDEEDAEEPIEIKPANLGRSLEGGREPVRAARGDAKEATATARPSHARSRFKKQAAVIGRVRIEDDLIPLEIVEEAVDCLLDGGIVAMPTDTVYGLAVDATNDEAVERLYELKGRDPERAIALFIDSQRELASLVRNLSVEVRNLLEAFWPGPLTVVFERRGTDFSRLCSGRTLGVRLPDHTVPLTLIQELRRPIACTSANPSGEPSASSAAQIERYFGEGVNMILDVGELPERPASTVLDVSKTPYCILREGSITRDQLGAVMGELLQSERG